MSASTRSGTTRDATGAAAARAVGVVAALGGAVAWAMAVAATEAARAAELARFEAGVPPGEDPSGVDSPGTVDLALHDARLGALVAVLLGMVLVTARTGAAARRPRRPVVLGGGAALVVGNAVVAPLLGAGPADVLAGAAALLALAAAGGAVQAAVAARLPSAPPGRSPERRLLTPVDLLVAAGAAAGTAGALGVDGLLGDGWGYLLVPAATASAALAAVVLSVLAVAFVLLARAAGPWRRGLLAVAAAAAAPGLVSVAVLLGGGPLEDAVGLVVGPLLVVLLPGGFLSLLLTSPAGAEVGVDGLPFVGGGTLLGVVVGLAAASLGLTEGRQDPAPATGTGRDGAPDLR